ncbi:MAG: anti-sigma factor family protein [Planctomycetia bacterium]
MTDIDSLGPPERDALLAAYRDGELDDATARAVVAWLDAHPDALRALEHDRRTWELLGRYGDEPVPPGFSARVLEAAGVRRRRLRLWQRPPVLAAAAALLVALGAGVGLAVRSARAPEAPALAAIDLDLVQHGSLEALLALSDAEFEALLAEDPDLLADASLGG